MKRAEAIEFLLNDLKAANGAAVNGIVESIVLATGETDEEIVTDLQTKSGEVTTTKKELDQVLFNQLMISELTDEDFNALVEFRKSPLGEKWLKERNEVQQTSLRAIKHIAKEVGLSMSRMLLFNMCVIMQLIVERLAPVWPHDKQQQFVLEIMKANPLRSVPPEFVEAMHDYLNKTSTGRTSPVLDDARAPGNTG